MGVRPTDTLASDIFARFGWRGSGLGSGFMRLLFIFIPSSSPTTNLCWITRATTKSATMLYSHHLCCGADVDALAGRRWISHMWRTSRSSIKVVVVIHAVGLDCFGGSEALLLPCIIDVVYGAYPILSVSDREVQTRSPRGR